MSQIFTALDESSPVSSSASSRATRVFEPRRRWTLVPAAELWRYRDLLWIFAVRDFKVRYKQSLFGVLWAVIPPLFTMLAFAGLFFLMGEKPVAEGSNYLLSAFCALLPWRLFADAMAHSGQSVVENANLVRKVYFPRLLLPAAPLLCGAVDHAIAFLLLLAMMAGFGVGLSGNIIALPLFFLLTLLSAMAVGVWFAGLNAMFRDVRYTIPIVAQIGMYLSPVVYETGAIIPERWQMLYSLNPMVSVIEGYRWALLGVEPPSWIAMTLSALSMFMLLLAGLAAFRHVETRLADII